MTIENGVCFCGNGMTHRHDGIEALIQQRDEAYRKHDLLILQNQELETLRKAAHYFCRVAKSKEEKGAGLLSTLDALDALDKLTENPKSQSVAIMVDAEGKTCCARCKERDYPLENHRCKV